MLNQPPPGYDNNPSRPETKSFKLKSEPAETSSFSLCRISSSCRICAIWMRAACSRPRDVPQHEARSPSPLKAQGWRAIWSPGPKWVMGIWLAAVPQPEPHPPAPLNLSFYTTRERNDEELGPSPCDRQKSRLHMNHQAKQLLVPKLNSDMPYNRVFFPNPLDRKPGTSPDTLNMSNAQASTPARPEANVASQNFIPPI